MARGSAPRAFVTSLALAAGACGGEPAEPAAERVVDLTRGFRPTPVVEFVQRWDAAEGESARITSAPDAIKCRIEHALPAASWRRAEDVPDGWLARLPGGAARRAEWRLGRLRFGEGHTARAEREGVLGSGRFVVRGQELLLRTLPGQTPGDGVLELAFESGAQSGESWIVSLGGFIGTGLPVWSGEREELRLDLPRASRLAFTLRHTNAAAQPVLFRVRLDGEGLAEIPFTAVMEREWFSFPLPPDGRAQATLSFELDGPPGLGCFVNPVLAPLEHGDYGARPWPDERPNLVLFVADTFRADNLALYGGAPEHAPELNRLAAESVCFLQARATSSWTLPSISALMTGCYPVQVGIQNTRDRLPEEVETLAEHLRRAGYRTGAVTDAVFFSPTYGLQRGFEWFEARERARWSLAGTLADVRSFLAGDDGRPLFLVVHTYRAHAPYRTGREEGLERWKALAAEVQAKSAGFKRAEREALVLAHSAQSLALYREGVQALDACFGEFRAALEAAGVLQRGVLAFTADHGEAFGENGVLLHGGSMWDTRLRVPLLIHGAGLAPRRVPWSVSSVDLAPTLAELAGVAGDPRWTGRSLLRAEADRSVYGFYGAGHEHWGGLGGAEFQFAVIDGPHKLLAASLEELAAGRPTEAYDVGIDPAEQHNRGADAPWAAELARAHAERMRALVDDGARGAPAELDENDLRVLEELGYAGED